MARHDEPEEDDETRREQEDTCLHCMSRPCCCDYEYERGQDRLDEAKEGL